MSSSGRRRTNRTSKGGRHKIGHDDFAMRITKTLYYGKLPTISCLSLPLMEFSSEVFSSPHKGKSLKRLYLEDATELTRNACVSPCSLVLALVYLERLNACNPEYVAEVAPTDLFLVSLMVSSKFLQDTGEEDEVFFDEWAASAGITSTALTQLEREFLHAIDWNIFVSESQFDSTLEWLEHQISLRQAKSRGWFTYTDLMSINNALDHIGLVKCLATVYAALSVSYVASVYSMVASSLIVSQGLIVLSSSSSPLALLNSCAHISSSSGMLNSTQPPDCDYAPDDLSYLERLTYVEPENNNITPGEDYRRPSYLTFLREMLQLTAISNTLDPIYDMVKNDKDLHDPVVDWVHRNKNHCNDNNYFPLQIERWSSAAVAIR